MNFDIGAISTYIPCNFSRASDQVGNTTMSLKKRLSQVDPLFLAFVFSEESVPKTVGAFLFGRTLHFRIYCTKSAGRFSIYL